MSLLLLNGLPSKVPAIQAVTTQLLIEVESAKVAQGIANVLLTLGYAVRPPLQVRETGKWHLIAYQGTTQPVELELSATMPPGGLST